jgi:hypothetical protein
MATKKTAKPKITKTQEAMFVELKDKVMQSRIPLLNKLSKSDLVKWAAHLETTLFCERIAYTTAIAKRAVGGGMKVTKKALDSNRLVPEAIADLLLNGKEITKKNIYEQLGEYPEVQNSKLGFEIVSENAVKEYVRAYRKTLFEQSKT